MAEEANFNKDLVIEDHKDTEKIFNPQTHKRGKRKRRDKATNQNKTLTWV